MTRNQWKAAVLAFLLFGCGAAVGALADHYYASSVVKAKGPEDFRHRYVSEMESKLKLTPAQITQLETILDDTSHPVRISLAGVTEGFFELFNVPMVANQ